MGLSKKNITERERKRGGLERRDDQRRLPGLGSFCRRAQIFAQVTFTTTTMGPSFFFLRHSGCLFVLFFLFMLQGGVLQWKKKIPFGVSSGRVIGREENIFSLGSHRVPHAFV